MWNGYYVGPFQAIPHSFAISETAIPLSSYRLIPRNKQIRQAFVCDLAAFIEGVPRARGRNHLLFSSSFFFYIAISFLSFHPTCLLGSLAVTGQWEKGGDGSLVR